MEWNAVSILPKEEDVVRNILVVDDEPVLCAVLQKMLTRLGFAVITAHDGLEAVKILANMQVDLVISDLRMPRMDGWMLLQQIKGKEPDLPVILITGYHSDYSESRAEESAADAYISKPFSFQQIRGVVHRVMDIKDQRNRSVTMIENQKEG
jgi:CheY-like chemotaxis protein